MFDLPTEDDPIRVVEGDSVRLLPAIPADAIDAVVTDPPYGMNWDTDTTRFSGGHNPSRRGAGRNDAKRVAGDDEPFDPSPWLQFPRVVLFGSNHYAQRLPVGTLLVWLKRNDHAFGSFLSDAEVAWMKGGHGVYCHRDLTMNREAGRRAHPTQKPVGLIQWAMERAKVPPGGLVLDPFGGSGTTAVACALTGRRCVVIEKEPLYIPVIRHRVREALGAGLLAGVGP